MEVFRIQRRNYDRFIFPKTKTAVVEFQDPKNAWETLRLKIVDLSPKGLAFYIRESDESYFQKGTLLRDFRFSYERLPITTLAKVVQARGGFYQDGKPVCRVAVTFLKITDSDVQSLTQLISEANARKMELVAF